MSMSSVYPRLSLDWLSSGALEDASIFFHRLNEVRCALIPAFIIVSNEGMASASVDLLHKISLSLTPTVHSTTAASSETNGGIANLQAEKNNESDHQPSTLPSSSILKIRERLSYYQVSQLAAHCKLALDICIGLLQKASDDDDANGLKRGSLINQLQALCARSEARQAIHLLNPFVIATLSPIDRATVLPVAFALYIVFLVCDYLANYPYGMKGSSAKIKSTADSNDEFFTSTTDGFSKAISIVSIPPLNRSNFRSTVSSTLSMLLLQQSHQNLSNDATAELLLRSLENYYPSMFLCCLLYDDLLETGAALPNVCFCGYYESTLHSRRKCCVVFYVQKSEVCSGVICKAVTQSIIDDDYSISHRPLSPTTRSISAPQHCRQLRQKFGELSIDSWGIACLTARTKPALRYNCSDGSVVVRRNDSLVTVVLLRGYKSSWCSNKFYIDR